MCNCSGLSYWMLYTVDKVKDFVHGNTYAGKYAGGNPVCPRPTPDWQKGINSFFSKKPSNKENQEPGASEEEPGCSGSSSDSAACQPGASGAGSSSSQPGAGNTER